MKKGIFFLTLTLSLHVFAAIPSAQEMTRPEVTSAEEILTLPEPLRKQTVEGKAEQLYPQMLAIAFSSKQSVEMRWKALTMIAHLRKENAIPDLKKALVSTDWFMRNAALLSLNSVSSEEGKKAAQLLLTDKALVVRSAAVEVLGPVMDSEIRDLFWKEMDAKYNFRQTQSLWIREQMLGYLSDNPSLAEKPLFAALSKQASPGMKTLAMNALKKLK